MQLFPTLSTFSLNQLNNRSSQPVPAQPAVLVAGVKPQTLNVDTFEPTSATAKTRSGWPFPTEFLAEINLARRRLGNTDVERGLGQVAYLFREVFAHHGVLARSSDDVTNATLIEALRHFTEVCGLHNEQYPIATKDGLAAIIFSHPQLPEHQYFPIYFNTNPDTIEYPYAESHTDTRGIRYLPSYLDLNIIERIHTIAKNAMQTKNMGITLNSEQHKKLVGNLVLSTIVNQSFIKDTPEFFIDWLGLGPERQGILPNRNDYYLTFRNFEFEKLSKDKGPIRCELHAIPINSVRLKEPKDSEKGKTLPFPTCIDITQF